MNDDELGELLRAEVPPPDSQYWDSINANLVRLQASDWTAGAPTEIPVDHDSEPGRPLRLTLAAAVIVLLAGALLTIVRLQDNDNVDTATDVSTETTGETIDKSPATSTIASGTSEDSPTTVTTVTETSGAPPTMATTTADATEEPLGTDETTTEAGSPGYQRRLCFIGHEPGLSVRMDIYDNGRIVAVRRSAEEPATRFEFGTGALMDDGTPRIEMWPSGSTKPANVELWAMGGATMTMAGKGEDILALVVPCQEITEELADMDAAMATEPRLSDS